MGFRLLPVSPQHAQYGPLPTFLMPYIWWLQELGKQNEWVSETIFSVLLVSFLVWTFSPFVAPKKRFYTAVLYARLLLVLVSEYPLSLLHRACAGVKLLRQRICSYTYLRCAVCQSLRIVSFLVTQLPAPNYHCRLGQPTAVRKPALHWYDHFVVDVARQV